MRRILQFVSLFLIIASSVSSQNLNVTLADQLSYGAEGLANVCDWKDPQDGKEYALVGAANGMSIVDVTNPSNVVAITQIPGPNCLWREIKTNGNYAYITTECGTTGLQIVDLTNLPATNLTTATWSPTISGTKLNTIHALHIENGRVYLYGSNVGAKGAIIADITTNPMVPVYLGKYDPRYIHDGYVRKDTLYAAHIYDGEVAVVNTSNPNNQTPMATFKTPGNFTHNTWLSQNSKICFTTDEVNDSYLAAFDISNLGNITELDRIQSNPGSASVAHNTHILYRSGAEYAVTSWYKDGFTIVDATRPRNLVQVGNYDTAPTASGSGMVNDWGVDPFLPSGTILASDMSNGLFVLSANYVRACYLEGIVKDCVTGNPISGYTVTIQVSSPQTNAHIDVTDALGKYAAGVPVPGNYQVIFAKTGSPTLTYTVSLSAGNVTALNPQINCAPFNLAGKVINTATSNGVPFANVRIQNGGTIRDTITDIAGNYTITALPAATYEVDAGKWGFKTNCLLNQNLSPSTGLLSIGIGAGIYDDFTWNWGWSAGGSAATGQWARGEPQGTMDGGNQANADLDVNTDCSQEAFVTGNTGVTASDDDVDGGDVKLTSPYVNLTSYANPYIFYSRWFYNAGSGANDTLKIILDNGITSKVLEKISASTPGNGTWISKSFKLLNYMVPTANVKITVRTEDLAPDNILEAGFDKFFVADSAATSLYSVSFDNVVVTQYPNPSNGEFHVQCSGANIRSVEITNIVGEIIFSNSQVVPQSIIHFDLRSFPAGMYLYKASDGEKLIGTGKIILE